MKDNVRVVLINACYSVISTGGIRDVQALSHPKPPLVRYMGPYLSEEQALQNIGSATSDAPVWVDLNFKPQPIDWKSTDGREKLVQPVVASVEEDVASLAAAEPGT